jgi:hypothetical protein
MPSAEVTISEPKISNVGQLHLEATLTNASGEPVVGQDVTFTVEGDGSLTGTFNAKEMRRETDAQGVAKAIWYRRGIFGRDVKATITASVPGSDQRLELKALTTDQVVTGPRTSWVPQEHRFGR